MKRHQKAKEVPNCRRSGLIFKHYIRKKRLSTVTVRSCGKERWEPDKEKVLSTTKKWTLFFDVWNGEIKFKLDNNRGEHKECLHLTKYLKI